MPNIYRKAITLYPFTPIYGGSRRERRGEGQAPLSLLLPPAGLSPRNTPFYPNLPFLPLSPGLCFSNLLFSNSIDAKNFTLNRGKPQKGTHNASPTNGNGNSPGTLLPGGQNPERQVRGMDDRTSPCRETRFSLQRRRTSRGQSRRSHLPTMWG